MLWEILKSCGVSSRPPSLKYEKYVRIVQDMYEDSATAVRCAVGMTDRFKVKVGLHQGSTEPFPVCNGDGQVDGRDQTGVSMDYDVRG